MKNKNFNQDKIMVSKHAIERFKLRQQREELSDREAIKRIQIQVRKSKLISISGNEEHRSYSGYLYVIKRKKDPKDIFGMRELINVITMKLSNVRKKEKFSRDFNENNINYESMGSHAPRVS
ncbi:MAG: hypothetical protein MJA82_14450 [Clostridia bacterium]|nr:hypothetical protein [Clostridia bacterium]